MQVEKQLTFGRDLRVRLALTLVELLVTVSIMGLIIAVSIPVVRPMLASNKVKSGADMVAGFLAQARNRAIEEGRPVGVTFERVLNYKDGDAYPYNGASVLMRQVAEPKPLSGFVKDVRVAVDFSGAPGIGIIKFYTWNSAGGWDPNPVELQYWSKLVQPGDQIQFDCKGPKYEISGTNTSFQIDMNSLANKYYPTPAHFADQGISVTPVSFKVFRKPQPGKIAPTMATPVALPEGVVVDLDSSGMGMVFYDKFGYAEKDVNGSAAGAWSVVRDMFCANGKSDQKSVTIMFSAMGEVDRIYFSKQDFGFNNDLECVIPSGPIYLNVGIWERAGFWQEDITKQADKPERWYVSNDYLPDEIPTLRNYHDMNNYWVTLFPRTGATRVNRLSDNNDSRVTSAAINDSRKLANSLHGSESL